MRKILRFIGLGPWGSWSSCKDVGKGPQKQKRTRKCSEGVCSALPLETKECSSWGTGDFKNLSSLAVISNFISFKVTTAAVT